MYSVAAGWQKDCCAKWDQGETDGHGDSFVLDLQLLVEVSADIYYSATEWLLIADRHSWYLPVKRLHRTTTEDVCKQLCIWFLDFGWPHAIRTDGGCNL